jgi:hypothetical protein
MQTPLTKSQTDAMFLRMVANEFEMFQPVISKVTEGRFCFAGAALRVIADKLERNGYDDDAPAPDAELKDIRERVYGSTLAHERAEALKEK